MKTRSLSLAALAALVFAVSACSDGKSATNAAPLQLKTNDLVSSQPPAPPIPPPPSVDASSYILIDAVNGQAIAAKNENVELEPASLTKIMTAYAVFDALRSGSLKLDDQVTISEHAWRVGGASTEGSTSFLPVHSQATVQILLQGMIVQSGNDASIALAERVAGSEEAFAHLMNSYAKRLGLTGTHFENSTGLPGPAHRTTARDVALLSAALIRDFPQYYPIFSERSYKFNGIQQTNRNGLLDKDSSVDGLKTGHTATAGFCLASSAKRDSMRLVAVVMGTKGVKQREESSLALLNYGFNFFETKALVDKDQALGRIRVWKGADAELEVGVQQAAVITIPRGRANSIQTKLEIPASLVAPVDRSAAVGKIAFVLDGKELASQPVYPRTDIAQAGILGRMFDSVRMKFE